MPLIIQPKTCLFCKWFDFTPGEGAYSDVTPGYDARFTCLQGKWGCSNFDDKDHFMRLLTTAEGCHEYRASEPANA